ncbi:MAG: restriction endonuclease subunit S [Prevotella sp.]|nr:restriction endonuclease subunit S [Prevotella sp.]
MNEWKEVRLGDVLDFHRGYDLPKSEMENGDIPVAGSNGIIGFHNKATAITPCITIGRSGSIGQPFYYERAWAHNTVLYIDDFKGNNPKFLYYLIKILPISNFAGGSAVPSLNRNHIHPLVIKFCDDIEKQKEIAGILSSLDAKIETNNKLNEKLEEMAQAIFKSWLDGCDETVQIDDLSLNITDYSKLNKDKVILINSSDVTNGFFDHHNYSDNNKLKGHFKKRFSKGDILYSQVRPRNRHWAYCYFDAEDYIASTQLMVIRNNPEKVSSLLLYQYLISDRVWNEFTLKTETRSGTFPQGNYEDLSKICVPYKKDNEKISKTLEHIYNIIYNRYDENQRLASLRDTLLPRLMSGELIV